MKQEKEFEFKFPWYRNALFILSPTYLYRRFVVRQKFYNIEFDRVMRLFGERRIDFLPGIENSSRGFKLILDKKTNLEFIQSGDHFVFSAYITSASEYPKGNVAIFDDIEKEHE